MTDGRSKRVGFTLIELLVVISIIALLISILLPSMTGARRTGQRVACMAHMREIAKGAAEYGNDNNDFIIGGPSTSGSYLRGAASAYGPAVQNWDFMGPMAFMWGMGLTLPSEGDTDGVAKRFNELRSHKAFLCASNRFLATQFGGPDAGTGWMVSYNTCRNQLFEAADIPSNFLEQLPKGWRPSLSRIGVASNKVFVADGSRYATATIPPDYDLSANAGWGGAFSDAGAYMTLSRSWDRSWVKGNGSRSGTGVDPREYAFRHSTSQPPPGAPGNAYKLNMAFYDGHVETQGDLEASDPNQWLPQGSTLRMAGGSARVWTDTRRHFALPGMMEIGP